MNRIIETFIVYHGITDLYAQRSTFLDEDDAVAFYNKQMEKYGRAALGINIKTISESEEIIA